MVVLKKNTAVVIKPCNNELSRHGQLLSPSWAPRSRTRLSIYPLVVRSLTLRIGDRRVLLNKADTIDTQQLMRVYGALMWSLGKVMQTPEVCRVYIGSFWEAPLSNFENRFLLEVRKRGQWGGLSASCVEGD